MVTRQGVPTGISICTSTSKQQVRTEAELIEAAKALFESSSRKHNAINSKVATIPIPSQIPGQKRSHSKTPTKLNPRHSLVRSVSASPEWVCIWSSFQLQNVRLATSIYCICFGYCHRLVERSVHDLTKLQIAAVQVRWFEDMPSQSLFQHQIP